ncbi:MAG: ATP-grasp domain-containing protein [Lachnospiraceae bacterium]|nr:ATP-grasp domain-containing protein [Lachnospiraceae bacterium]
MIREVKNHEVIIFALDHYNPLGLVRSFGEEGIHSIVVAQKSRTDISRYSKYTKEYIAVETTQEGYEWLMSHYQETAFENRPFLLTCDDRTIEFLDNRYDEWKNRFIGFNGGNQGVITKYMDKYVILEAAKRHGLKVLDTITVDKGEVPANIEYPIITKSISPVVGGWKSDVFICDTENELREAYKKIRAPKVIIQKYIEKKNEYCLDGFCAKNGEIMFTSIETTYNYLIKGYYSPYMTVKNFNKPEIKKPLEDLMREVGFEGIYSIEFLIDQDDQMYFSEINFRNSTWSYASTCAGMNLPMLWAKAMLSGEAPVNAVRDIPDGFMAMVEPIDYAKRVKTGQITAGEWLKDFKEAKCGYYYSAEDPAPFCECVKKWDYLG